MVSRVDSDTGVHSCCSVWGEVCSAHCRLHCTPSPAQHRPGQAVASRSSCRPVITQNSSQRLLTTLLQLTIEEVFNDTIQPLLILLYNDRIENQKLFKCGDTCAVVTVSCYQHTTYHFVLPGSVGLHNSVVRGRPGC